MVDNRHEHKIDSGRKELKETAKSGGEYTRLECTILYVYNVGLFVGLRTGNETRLAINVQRKTLSRLKGHV